MKLVNFIKFNVMIELSMGGKRDDRNCLKLDQFEAKMRKIY